MLMELVLLMACVPLIDSGHAALLTFSVRLVLIILNVLDCFPFSCFVFRDLVLLVLMVLMA